MRKRKVVFRISEDQAVILMSPPYGAGTTTAIKLIGGEEVSLGVICDAVDQLLVIFPEVPWYFEPDASMRSDELIAYLLPC